MVVAGAVMWPAARAGRPANAGLTEARGGGTQLRDEAARARDRAAVLDRQARAATLASERATISAAALAARIQQGEAALAAADADLAEISERRRALDLRLAGERAPVAQLLAGLQSNARRPALVGLLQPGSIEDAVHLRAVLAALAPQIEERTTALRGSLQRVNGLEQEAARAVAERRTLEARLLSQRDELSALSAAERLKARRAAGAADREAERAFALGERARDLPALVRQLDTARAGPPTPAAPGAAFGLPVEGIRLPEGSQGSFHLALAPRPGALAVAPAAGRVAFAGPYRGYGAIVILDHAGGWTSLITGLASTEVAVGQAVVAGSPLGRAAQASPQIGFELRRDGRRVRPLDHLR